MTYKPVMMPHSTSMAGYGQWKTCGTQVQHRCFLAHRLVKQGTLLSPSVTWLLPPQILPGGGGGGTVSRIRSIGPTATNPWWIMEYRFLQLLPLAWENQGIVCITQGHHIENLWHYKIQREKMSTTVNVTTYLLLHMTVQKFNLIYKPSV